MFSCLLFVFVREREREWVCVRAREVAYKGNETAYKVALERAWLSNALTLL